MKCGYLLKTCLQFHVIIKWPLMFHLHFVPDVKDEVLVLVRRPQKNNIEELIIFIFVFVIGGCDLHQNWMNLNQSHSD